MSEIACDRRVKVPPCMDTLARVGCMGPNFFQCCVSVSIALAYYISSCGLKYQGFALGPGHVLGRDGLLLAGLLSKEYTQTQCSSKCS